MARPQKINVLQLLKKRRPELEDYEELVLAGRVLVDEKPVLNPRAMVSSQASLRVTADRELQGAKKLRGALEHFRISVENLTCVDCGASTGGFTSVLLEAGCKKVYSVDVGYGQLLGSLRQNDRVVNLEKTNVAELSLDLVPDSVDFVSVDLSYLALSEAVPQIVGGLKLSPQAQFVVLVKPMYELRLAGPPTDDETLEKAVLHAADAMSSSGLDVLGHMPSPVRGSRGAIEFLIHAVSRPAAD